jgi:ubiquinol-cytochrome c reductase iron-sulfur subunit
MSFQPPPDTRRRFLLRSLAKLMATAGLLLVGIAFVSTLFSTAREAPDPTEINLRGLAPGELLLADWNGRQVLVLHRTLEMITALEAENGALLDPESRRSRQPPAAKNPLRSVHPGYFVAIAHGTDLGCEVALVPPGDPALEPGSAGGFRDRCRGSRYDLAGRVYRGQEAPRNLDIPPHRFLDEARLLIGGE